MENAERGKQTSRSDDDMSENRAYNEVTAGEDMWDDQATGNYEMIAVEISENLAYEGLQSGLELEEQHSTATPTVQKWREQSLEAR